MLKLNEQKSAMMTIITIVMYSDFSAPDLLKRFAS